MRDATGLAETNRPRVADSSWQALFRAGAVSAGMATLLYLAGLILVVTTASPPADPTGAEMLAYVSEHRALYYLKQLLWIVPSLPMMVVCLALAAAGWQASQSLALVAGAVSTFSWAGSFAWLTSGEGSLAMPLLADRHDAAGTDAERAIFVAGAEVVMAVNDMATPLGVLQTVGIVLLGALLLRTGCTRAVGWFTVATGGLGIVSESFRLQLGWSYAMYGLLLFAWLVWVALVLWRMGATAT